MKAHPLVFEHPDGKRALPVAAIDGLKSVEKRHLSSNGTMGLASTESAHELSDERPAAVPRTRVVITTVDTDQEGGWLPTSIRTLLDQPVSTNVRMDA